MTPFKFYILKATFLKTFHFVFTSNLGRDSSKDFMSYSNYQNTLVFFYVWYSLSPNKLLILVGFEYFALKFDWFLLDKILQSVSSSICQA